MMNCVYYYCLLNVRLSPDIKTRSNGVPPILSTFMSYQYNLFHGRKKVLRMGNVGK